MPAPSAPSLSAVHDKRFVLVSGKGGVGKSAVAAAIARSAAAEGRRTLALSMIGNGMGLGAHLGATRLEFKPVTVQPDLSALAIDRAKALVEYLQIQVGLPSYATFGPAVRAFDVLASTAPAIREIVTMGKVLWEVKTGRWDLVVADGPPTGQIGSFLRAATTMSELVSSGRIADQSKWMRDILTDPQATSLVLVSLAEELPTNETLETLDWLDRNPVVGSTTVVANRVLTPLQDDSTPDGAIGEAAVLHRSISDEQRIWLDRLPADTELPFLFGIDAPDRISAVLAEHITESHR